jgi:hypothetical protein
MPTLLGEALHPYGKLNQCLLAPVSLSEKKDSLECFKAPHEAISISESPQVLLMTLGCGSDKVGQIEATVVIIVEPWWQSTLEQQAIDRLHRRGQEEEVTVNRLIVSNSIEEYVRQVQQYKVLESKQGYAESNLKGVEKASKPFKYLEFIRKTLHLEEGVKERKQVDYRSTEDYWNVSFPSDSDIEEINLAAKKERTSWTSSIWHHDIENSDSDEDSDELLSNRSQKPPKEYLYCGLKSTIVPM